MRGKVKKVLDKRSVLCYDARTDQTKKGVMMSSSNLKVVKKEEDEVTTKEDRITDYVKSLVAIEEEMEPYKEQKRALKSNYVENGWLSKDEISVAVKALRLMKSDVDLEQIQDFIDLYKKTKVG